MKNIHLNATVYYTTETIGVTMDVMCSGTGDEVKIWYYNGSTWTEEFYDATCNYAAAAGNYTDSIKIRGTGTHYIRGQVTYGTLSGDDQCFTGPYGDNDDLSFVVEVYSPPAGGCCTFSDGYCACAPACSPVDMDAFMEGCFT